MRRLDPGGPPFFTLTDRTDGYVQLAVLAAATVVDLRSRRVPAWLTGG